MRNMLHPALVFMCIHVIFAGDFNVTDFALVAHK